MATLVYDAARAKRCVAPFLAVNRIPGGVKKTPPGLARVCTTLGMFWLLRSLNFCMSSFQNALSAAACFKLVAAWRAIRRRSAATAKRADASTPIVILRNPPVLLLRLAAAAAVALGL